MVKVLTILSCLDGGGVETILLNYLRNFDFEKIQMDIIVHGEKEGILEEEYRKLGCNIFRVTPKSISIVKNFREIRQIIKCGKYDIVHSRMNYKGVTHMLAGSTCGIPTRIIHNHQANMENNYSLLRKMVINVLRKITMSLATDYMACSEAAAIDMFGKKNFNRNKVVILKNALNLDKYELLPIIRDNYRNELAIKNTEIVIGMVGRFHYQKNHDFMIKVFEKIVDSDRDYVLLLVGGDDEVDSHRKIVTDNNQIRDKVIFTGVRNDVPNLMQAMDLLVLPSRYEGFGNVAIESQVSGLPTLASDMVPRETKITELIEYLPLDQGEDFWAKYILEMDLEPQDRRNHFQEARDAGFDIVEAAKFLEKVYLQAE